MSDLGRFERDTAWAAAQWKGRIVNYVHLESTLAEAEIRDVARHVFPEGDSAAVEALAAFVQVSPSYLAAIGTAAFRARFLASHEGAQVSTDHIKRAINEQLGLVRDLTKAVAPKKRERDRSKSASLAELAPTPAAEHFSRNAPALSLQAGCRSVSTRIPEPSLALVDAR